MLDVSGTHPSPDCSLLDGPRMQASRAGSLEAYRRSIECYKKEKSARQQAKEKALQRAHAHRAALPNGDAHPSAAADAGLRPNSTDITLTSELCSGRRP